MPSALSHCCSMKAADLTEEKGGWASNGGSRSADAPFWWTPKALNLVTICSFVMHLHPCSMQTGFSKPVDIFQNCQEPDSTAQRCLLRNFGVRPYSARQRGGWVFLSMPSHVPSESEQTCLFTWQGHEETQSQCQAASQPCSSRQRGGWVALVAPSHVPAESVQKLASCGQQDNVTQPCSARQRGGWANNIMPGHVPSESELTYILPAGHCVMPTEHTDATCGLACLIDDDWRPPNGNAPEQRGGESRLWHLAPHVPAAFCRALAQLVTAGSMLARLDRQNECLTEDRFPVCSTSRSYCSSPPGCRSSDWGICSGHDAAGLFQANCCQERMLRTVPYWYCFYGLVIEGFQNGVCLQFELSQLCFPVLHSFNGCLGYPGLNFGEGSPFRLAGSHVFLHRQNVLPVVCAFTKATLRFQYALFQRSSLVGSFFGGDAVVVDDAPYTMVADNGFIGSIPYLRKADGAADETLFGASADVANKSNGPIIPQCHVLVATLNAKDAYDNSWHRCFGHGARRILYEFRPFMEYVLQRICGWCVDLSVVFAATVEEYLLAFFRTGALCFLIYMGRMISFACSIKGGTHNADNIVRLYRQACKGVPWHLGYALAGFSPTMDAILKARTLQCKKSRGRPRFSYDLWLLLCIVSLCFGQARAARGWRFSSEPTRYPSLDMSGYRFDMRQEVLQAQRQAAAGNIGSESESYSEEEADADEESGSSYSLDPAPPQPRSPFPHYVPRSFRIIAYAHRPEFLAASFREGTAMDRALEMMDVDSILANCCGKGFFVAQRGMPISDDFHVVWVPAWMPFTSGCIIVVEATLLSLGTFACHIPNSILSRDFVRAMMPELGEQEWHLFVPAHLEGPLASGESIRLSAGDVVHLQPDPMGPFVHDSNEVAFDDFPLWGTDEFFDGFDRPWGQQLILIVGIETPMLLDFHHEEDEPDIIRRVCAQLGMPTDGISLQWPQVPFFQLAHNGQPIVKVACLLFSPLKDLEVVAFVDGRLVMQSITAVRLDSSLLPRADIVDLLRLEVRMVYGFQMWIEGGQRVAGNLVINNGGTLRPQLVPNSEEFVSSDDASSPCSDPGSRHGGGGDRSDAQGDEGRLCDHSEPTGEHPNHSASSTDISGFRSHHVTGGDGQRSTALLRRGQHLHVGAGMPADHSDQIAAVADMWNRPFLGSSAFLTGRTGDTSTDVAALHYMYPEQQMMGGEPAGSATSCKMRRRGTSFGSKLTLFVVWFAQQVTAGTSARIDPFCDSNVVELDSGQLCGWHTRCAADRFTADAFNAPGFNLQQGWAVEWSSDLQELSELEYLPTLLEQAKGNEFRRTCAELGYFVDCLLRRFPCGLAMSRHDACSSECLVQCTEMLHSDSVCHLSHSAQSEKLLSKGSVKCTLSLDLLVGGPTPLRPEQITCQLQSGADASMLGVICEGHHLQQLDQHVSHCSGLHQHTQIALSNIVVWNKHDNFTRVALYTDGSYKEAQDAVGFAVVCLVEVCDEWQFTGYKAGAIQMSAMQNRVTACSHVAELCGMIHAEIIGICVGQKVPMKVWYDCESAQQVMRFCTPKTGPLEEVASSVSAVCQHLKVDFAWEHVLGHSGDPWNEFADALAKQALYGSLSADDEDQDVIVPMVCEDWAKWLWMCIATEQDPLPWPSLRQDGTFVSGKQGQRCHRPQARCR